MTKRPTSSPRGQNRWQPGTPLSSHQIDAMMDNPGSTRIARVAGLARRATRNRYGRFLVEGPHSAREAVSYAPSYVHDLYMTPDAVERDASLLAAARAAGLHCHVVSPIVMSAMSTDAQGVLAVVDTAALEARAVPFTGGRTHQRRDQAGAAGQGSSRSGSDSDAHTVSQRLAEMLASSRLVAVLTEIQDPGNAGTIIRVADAAGADAVLVLRGSVDVTNPKVVRSTAGSLFHLPVLDGLTLEQVSHALHEAGLSLLAADARGETSLFDHETDLAQPTAWLLGNEARGLSDQVRQEADAVVSIPIYGAAESLNVATAATVCLYSSARAQQVGTTSRQ